MFSMSYLQRLKRDRWATRVRGVVKNGGGEGALKPLLGAWLAALRSSSLPNRTMAVAYLIMARTASILGVQLYGSDGAFPPR